MYERKIEPPIKPCNHLKNPEDTSLFDTRFTKQPAIDSPDDAKLSESMNQVFQGFTYIKDDNYYLNDEMIYKNKIVE